jgi:alkanesulfonate monooxygenase SsuD/methylene tetrahydromethanopterin reductase-like flavin-dependent oxidoreductase (luciferase family)
MADLIYGALLTTVSAEGEDETSSIQQFFRNCDTAHEHGYEAVWMTEHHFSSYHPVPDPFVMLSHVAARCPGMGLGTSVLVTPWHHPLRLAGQIAALTNITDAPIYIGMGRGNAPMEYEAFGVDMNYAKESFAECWEILQLAMTGEPFTYRGEQHKVEREIAIHPRPRVRNLHFYGAVGQPSSASRIGEQGLALIANANTTMDIQRGIVDSWAAAAKGRPDVLKAPKVVSPWTIIAETDQEAERLALRYLGEQIKLSEAHYVLDKERHANIRGYEKMAEHKFVQLARPQQEKVRDFMSKSFVGSPATVARRMRDLQEVGFDYFLINPSIPASPHELRREWLARFAQQVMPLMDDVKLAANAN